MLCSFGLRENLPASHITLYFANRLWDAPRTLIPQWLVEGYYEEISCNVIDKCSIHNEEIPGNGLRWCDNFASFVDHCLSFGLERAVRTVLLKIEREIFNYAGSDDAYTETMNAIDSLRQMVPLLSKYNIPLDHPFYSTVFRNAFDSYIIKYVGQEPEKSRTWERRAMLCECNDICAGVNEFLQHPKVQTRAFLESSKTIRDHVKRELQRAGVRCTQRVEGQTILLTKIDEAYQSKYHGWSFRKDHASRVLASFDKEVLKAILGDQYEVITNMHRVTLASLPQQNSPSGRSHLPSLAGPTQPSSGNTGPTRGIQAGVPHVPQQPPKPRPQAEAQSQSEPQPRNTRNALKRKAGKELETMERT